MFPYGDLHSQRGLDRICAEVAAVSDLDEFVIRCAAPHPISGRTWDEAAEFFTAARRRCEFYARTATDRVAAFEDCAAGHADECPTSPDDPSSCRCATAADDERALEFHWRLHVEQFTRLVTACEDRRSAFTAAERAERRTMTTARSRAREFAVHRAGGVR